MPVYLDPLDRTSETAASGAHESCAVRSPLSLKLDASACHIDTVHWTADIHGGGHIWGKHIHPSTVQMPDTLGTVSRWGTVSETFPVADLFSQ